MTPTPGSPGTLTADAPVASDGKDLLSALLADQQTFTAVDRFAQIHEAGDLPAQAAYYKSLIPTDQPKAGQQYAFEVNLDACTGCKG